MPSPKNRMKSTGDTHLPEVELDMTDVGEPREATAEEEDNTRVFADGYVPPGTSAGSVEAASASSGGASMVDTLRGHATKSPLMMAGAVLAVGFVLAKLLRR